jgi:predicted DNA-binding transcriptional regulator AlpA
MQPSVATPETVIDPPASKKQQKHLMVRLLVRAPEVAELRSISEVTIWRFHSAGTIPEGTLPGHCRAWSRRELEEWFAGGCPDRAVWAAMKAAAGRQAKRGA